MPSSREHFNTDKITARKQRTYYVWDGMTQASVPWCPPVIPAPQGRPRQEDLEFKASLGCTVRPCLKNKQANKSSSA
jgi:hypothetical protein